MSRAERWWRPSTTRRPAQRARARRAYTDQELDKTFDIGYTVGQADERKRHERRDEQGGDDLLDVAQAAGATPAADVDGGQFADEVERWLAEQSDGDA